MEAALEYVAPIKGKDLKDNIWRMMETMDANEGLVSLGSNARLLVAATAIAYRAERSADAMKKVTDASGRKAPEELRKYASVSLISEIATIIEMHQRGEFVLE